MGKKDKSDPAAPGAPPAAQQPGQYAQEAAQAPHEEDMTPEEVQQEKDGKKLKINLDLEKYKKMSPAQRDELRAANEQKYVQMATEQELDDIENSGMLDFSGVSREGTPIVVLNNLLFPTKKTKVRRVALYILKQLVAMEGKLFNILFVASEMKELKNLDMARAINCLCRQLHLTMTKNLGALIVLHGSNALKFSIQVMYGNPEVLFFDSVVDMFHQVPPYQSLPESVFSNEDIKGVSKKKLLMSMEEIKAVVERVHGNHASLQEQEAALAGLVGCKLNLKESNIPVVDEEINGRAGPYFVMNGLHVMKLLHVNSYLFSRAMEFHAKYTEIANMQNEGAEGKRKNNVHKKSKKSKKEIKEIQAADYDQEKDEELQHLMFDTSQFIETINSELTTWNNKEPRICSGILLEGMREDLISTVNDPDWVDPTQPEWKRAPFEDKIRLTPDQRMKFMASRLQHEEEVELFKRKIVRIFGGKKKLESFKNRPNAPKLASLGEKQPEVVCAYPGCGQADFSSIAAFEEHRVWHAKSHSRTPA